MYLHNLERVRGYILRMCECLYNTRAFVGCGVFGNSNNSGINNEFITTNSCK